MTGILVLATILGWQQVNFPMQSIYGAGTLTNVFVSPSANVFSTTSYYTISFNTATPGIIKSIEITFPSGFNIASTKLIEVQGIGPGSMTITGQILKYSVSSPVLVSASKSIKIMISDVTNSASPSNQVSVVTKDNSIHSAIIDGPTKSAAFTLTPVTNSMIGNNAITSTKIAPDSVDTSKIKNGQVTLADMAPNSVYNSTIIDNSIVKADISTGFLKKVSRTYGGTDWIPDNTRDWFLIRDPQVTPSSFVQISVSTTYPATPPDCYVHDVYTKWFYILCKTPPDFYDILNYVVIN